MIQILAYTIIGLYTLALAYVTIYCLFQFHLLYQYGKGRKNINTTLFPHHVNDQDLPMVTIQLPLFNERYVVQRLIDNIMHMDYPADKLEVQVLDDSTDDTSVVCRQKITEYRKQGKNIQYYPRPARDGFKAGALRDGLVDAKGEFIAIFDADFLPKPDFLRQTIPFFNDQKVGAVQTRWEHINGNHSIITRLQAFQLNVHFTIEQTGRQHGNYLLQFNGTAGVWRRETILDAGGWEADTLTEDLDLSYRAQLKGWKIKYMQDVVSPAELPSEMNGLKSQQFRWMKGGAENARKLLSVVIRSEMHWLKKMHATTHLLSSSIFLFVFTLGILSVPALFLMNTIHLDIRVYGVFMIGLMTAGCVYYVANRDTAWMADTVYTRMMKFTLLFPLFLSLSMGLSFHNSIAVVQGYMGRKSVFVRTPKFNILHSQDGSTKENYNINRITGITVMEGLLSLYFLTAIIGGLEMGKTSFILYHTMLVIGFGSIFIYSVKHTLDK